MASKGLITSALIIEYSLHKSTGNVPRFDKRMGSPDASHVTIEFDETANQKKLVYYIMAKATNGYYSCEV